MHIVADFWATVQRRLFPYLEEVLPPNLPERLREFILVLEVVRLEQYVAASGQWLGRHPYDRRPLARAFLAKAFYNLPTTEALWEPGAHWAQVDEALRQVCGWECRRQVPSLSTFSRAFAEFAAEDLGDRVHAALVAHYGEDTLFWHVSRDSTAIAARERPAAAAKAPVPEGAPPPPKRRPGRPRKDEIRPPKEETRLERQYRTPLAQTRELLAELPQACDVGTKKDASGKKISWTGYKLHMDVGDTGLPLLAFTTSASLHDSQPAIHMLRLTAQRVTSLYDLMDSAYDAKAIRDTCADLGHVAIIDLNPRSNAVKPPPTEPDRARRYGQRSAAERFNSDLKDNHGGRTVRVRGARKVHTHLMFGVLAIFAGVVLGWTS